MLLATFWVVLILFSWVTKREVRNYGDAETLKLRKIVLDRTKLYGTVVLVFGTLGAFFWTGWRYDRTSNQSGGKIVPGKIQKQEYKNEQQRSDNVRKQGRDLQDRGQQDLNKFREERLKSGRSNY